MHWRRAQLGSDKEALRRFHGSEFAARLREGTKTEKRPEGVSVSLKLLTKFNLYSSYEYYRICPAPHTFDHFGPLFGSLCKFRGVAKKPC